MAKMKVVINPRPLTIQRNEEVGIALQIDYQMVEPLSPGFDLFDKSQLERLKQDFIPLNESHYSFTITPGPVQQWSYVFAELKAK
jgi:hypothetical protein